MAKLLAHDWSSCCLATYYSIEKLLFYNNVVSFRVDEEHIYELEGKSENQNKKNSSEVERTFSKSGRVKESCKQIWKM